MKSVLLGLAALMLLTGAAGRAFAANAVEYPIRYETCGAICQILRYVDSDHMVAMVPAPPPGTAPESKRGTVKARKMKRAFAAGPGRLSAPHAAARVAARPSVRRSAPEPMDTLFASPRPSSVPTIPGAAPVVTARFELQ